MIRLLHRPQKVLCYDRFVTHMRRYLLIFLAVCCLSTVSSGQSAPPAPPKLILVVSVDQMRFDFLERFAPLYRSGLKTLLERGAVFSNAKYRHAATETGPGHSILLTGSDPKHSGIVANDWWDPYLKRVVNVVDDPVQTTDRRVRPGRFAGKPADVYGRRCAEKQEPPLACRRRRCQRSFGHSDGGASRRCGLLVRERGRQLHHQQLLHEGRARSGSTTGTASATPTDSPRKAGRG